MTQPTIACLPGLSVMRPTWDGAALELVCPGCGERFRLEPAAFQAGCAEVFLRHEAGCRFLAMVERLESMGVMLPEDRAQWRRWSAGAKE